ncbi:MAG: FMN-binding protein [Lachnospiraceae bacterium]
MREFWIRTVSVLAIVGILFGYNMVLEARAKDEQITELNGRLAEAQEAAASEENSGGGNYLDGTYTGEADGFGGTVSVEVTVSDGSITGIDIISADGEDGAYLTMAEDIIQAIIEAQSAEVDTISGATFSSGGIRDATAQALEKAVN